MKQAELSLNLTTKRKREFLAEMALLHNSSVAVR